MTLNPGLARSLAILLALTGCEPTCTQLCTKLDRCDLSATVTVAECQASCDAQLDFFNQEPTAAEEEALYHDQRVCIGAHSCDELRAGACYEDALFPATTI